MARAIGRCTAPFASAFPTRPWDRIPCRTQRCGSWKPSSALSIPRAGPWERRRAVPGSDGSDFSVTANRGVAILNDKVFFGTPDARLIAVSAATGALQWEATVATDAARYAITGAPLAYRDLVVTGVAIRGSAAGGQGFI